MASTRTPAPEKTDERAAGADAAQEAQAEREQAAEPFRVPVPEPDHRSLDERIGAVMQECERIPKAGWNDHHKYAFARESDVTDAIRASCGRHGITVRPRMLLEGLEEHEITAGDRTGVALRIPFVFRVSCPEGHEDHDWLGEAWDYPGEKAIPKAVTMAKKTFLVAFFLLSTGDDAEASSDGDTGQRSASSGSGRGAGGGARQERTLSPRQIGMLIGKGKERGMSANDVRTLIGWRCERQYPLGLSDVADAPGGKDFVDGLIRDIGLWTGSTDQVQALEKYRDRVLARNDEVRAREAAAAAQAASGEPEPEQTTAAAASDGADSNSIATDGAPAPPESDTDERLFREPGRGDDPEPPAWSTPARKECTCGVGDDETDPAKHSNGCDLSIPF